MLRCAICFKSFDNKPLIRLLELRETRRSSQKSLYHLREIHRMISSHHRTLVHELGAALLRNHGWRWSLTAVVKHFMQLLKIILSATANGQTPTEWLADKQVLQRRCVLPDKASSHTAAAILLASVWVLFGVAWMYWLWFPAVWIWLAGYPNPKSLLSPAPDLLPLWYFQSYRQDQLQPSHDKHSPRISSSFSTASEFPGTALNNQGFDDGSAEVMLQKQSLA